MNNLLELEYLIDKAIKFATRAHSGQFRKGSDLPYITHPFAVAIILAKEGASKEQIIAGILHDVVEDTEVTISTIEENFGKKVADLALAAYNAGPDAVRRAIEESGSENIQFVTANLKTETVQHM